MYEKSIEILIGHVINDPRSQSFVRSLLKGSLFEFRIGAGYTDGGLFSAFLSSSRRLLTYGIHICHDLLLTDLCLLTVHDYTFQICVMLFNFYSSFNVVK
jgi:hypothetical protein